MESAAACPEEGRIGPVVEPWRHRVRALYGEPRCPAEHGKAARRIGMASDSDDGLTVLVVHRLPEGGLLEPLLGVGVVGQSESRSVHLNAVSQVRETHTTETSSSNLPDDVFAIEISLATAWSMPLADRTAFETWSSFTLFHRPSVATTSTSPVAMRPVKSSAYAPLPILGLRLCLAVSS